jgi:hypothetical protein
MSKRGMRGGDMAVPDIIEILGSIVLPTLTFGLASTDLNKHDRVKLRSTLNTATQAALSMQSHHDPTNMWAALELGITDPVDDIRITDWATLIDMADNKANTLASEIVTNDLELQEAVMKVKTKWESNANNLKRTHKKERHAWLKHKARAHRIQKTNGTYFCPKGTPVWSTSSLTQAHISLLVKYRAMTSQGRIIPIKHCILCHKMNIAHEPIQHYLAHCSHGALIAQNPERFKQLAPQDIVTWTTLNEKKMNDLCAHPKGKESMIALALDTLNHCQIFEPEITNFAQ